DRAEELAADDDRNADLDHPGMAGAPMRLRNVALVGVRVTQREGDVAQRAAAGVEAFLGVGHELAHLSVELVDRAFGDGADAAVGVGEGDAEIPTTADDLRELPDDPQVRQFRPIDEIHARATLAWISRGGQSARAS